MDALIVAGATKQQYALADVVNRIGLSPVLCTTAAEARRASLSRPFHVFIVNGGLPDEHGNELCSDLADAFDCGGVFIDDFTRAEIAAAKLVEQGVITLSRPITKSGLSDALRLVLAANARVRMLKEKNTELSAKLEDLKYISRAKIVLMRSLGYSEEQAHRYIEKKSMDSRLSRRRVAMDILKTYEA